ncbi:PspC domain-containing protein [Helcobacillus massiliensis]|uniref:Signal transduction histidine kinase/phage shock protein PspC (Stress-responsive transcriptional regulator) n=1 Tax=Helcobacillus massiliensis TaxID=521392 RepID=A0A839R2U5_9MICO|nr:MULTISPECIES: PspC domain-containing protein [Helcobacillus]MBB3023466.1 signal transduction histidine kinase/phage shock protein PspC (stress-responsive transcriptional regulator) [Helcobacillus massiliensis]MCG7427359.1 PspC domain-containing protein [Helcobacillus sp. ACRRO]MCT1557928.1 PspC domain-containing protein [Helcobacillus massiliensis]MCT2036552.1 PspC domain-containing protein [Helcobacillus massiliensis]MCT2332547.1 PspC domain-containing protein [Helcobacillus massiliensis]
MPEITQPSADRWARTLTDAQLVGVCGALARGCGVPVAPIRGLTLLSFVMIFAAVPVTLGLNQPPMVALTFAGLASGIVFAYMVAWWALPLDESAERELLMGLSQAPMRGRPALSDASMALRSPASQLLQWMLIAALVGAAVMLTVTGIGTTVVWALPSWPQIAAFCGISAAGIALGVLPLNAVDRARWGGRIAQVPSVAIVALGLSVVLLLAGSLGMAAALFGPRALLVALAVAVIVMLLVAAVLVPWLRRLWRGLQEESQERALAQQRQEITAHLHDSVLQTLTVIQQSGRDGESMKQLARLQEAELRRWLYGQQDAQAEADGSSLRTAVEEMCADLQAEHAVEIVTVIVGDAPLCPRARPLVKALREATSNAVRHGGTGVRVFVDISPDVIEAFVRDRGEGFDLDAVPEDRLGVRESIIGRMRRAGGTARVRRAAGGGMEVALRLERPEEGQP